MRGLICGFVLAGLLWAPGPVRAQLETLETEDARVIYLAPTQTFLAPYAARSLHNSLGYHRRLFAYEPPEKITLLLRDLKDWGGAGATAVPRDLLFVDIAPKSFVYETYPANERMNTYMNHEMVHLVATDMAARRERFFRALFLGKVVETAENPETILYGYLTNPRASAPRWYHEGVAVFVETWMAGGIGRAQGSYDEMVFRSKVRDSSLIYDPLGLASEGTKTDFQLQANSYLYGTRFVSYLAYRHGPEAVIEWVSRADGSRAYYAAQFRQVFGTSISAAWNEWIAWERDFQQSNLDRIRSYPVTPYEDLSDRALGAVSRAFLDTVTGKLYVAFNHPGVVPHIGAISLEDGSVQRIREVKDPMGYAVTSLAWDPDARTLFYTSDNYAFRDLVELDPATGKSRTLLKDARIGEIVFVRSDRSLWGLRHFNGVSTLVRIPFPYEEWQHVHSWPYGEVAYDMDIAPDGRLLSVSVGEINGRHALRVLEVEALLGGEIVTRAVVDFGTTIASNFVFSADGRHLYGSSYYTGVSNIFRYDLETKSLDALSNCETGMFRPLPVEASASRAAEELIVFRYTGDGFVPARIQAHPLKDVSAITFLGEQVVSAHPVLIDWMAGSPAEVDLDSRITVQKRYEGLKAVRLESLYPVVQGYRNTEAYGVRANFSDPLFVNRFHITASYTPDDRTPSDEKLHLDLQYRRYDWRAFFRLNGADFYDLFGPTKTSRKGYAAGVGYKRALIYDLPRQLDLSWGVAAYGDLDRLPDYQNVEATFDELYSSSVRLGYRNLRASLGAVDYEKGLSTEMLVTNELVNDRWVPGFIGNLDVGFPLPLHHSSVWLRNSVGAKWGDLDNPFANYFFGGFGNNYVDHRSVQRYRDFYSLPGLELNEVGGRNYAKTIIDWNLPPIIFRRVGSPGFYLTLARSSLFVSGLVTNLDDDDFRTEVMDVGGQMDFRFTALSRLEMTLSLGYAVALERGVGPRDEFMISLKILR